MERSNYWMNNVQGLLEEVGKEDLSIDKLIFSSSSKVLPGRNSKHCLSLAPRLSCPGSTKSCENSCYACNGTFLYRNVKKAHIRNFLIIKKMLEEGKKESLINFFASKIYSRYFRLFEAGDFFSQDLVDCFNEVCQRTNTIFWAYSRSFHLDFSNIIKNDNFFLRLSIDKDNIKKGKEIGKKLNIPLAYMLDSEETKPKKGSIICPHQTGKKESCFDCKICFQTNKNVSFLFH